MSKKQRKQKQKNKLFLPLIILGGVLLIAAAFYFAHQSGGDGGGTPSIAVDQQKIDYGDVKFGVNKTFVIKVTNTGDGTLRFKEEPYIEVLEGC
jgi:flagellar basal body-associated protein FliL